MKKILIMGLPGAGKTTLAQQLAPRLNAVHFNADDIRTQINRDLGFSEVDRIEQARRMGWLCDRVTATGGYAIADFICPTPATRAAFFAGGPGFTAFIDRVKECPFADTNAMFVPPEQCDLYIMGGSVSHWVDRIVERVRPVFDPRRPTALIVGRYQPFHAGHKALIVEGIRRHGQAVIAVRDTAGIDHKNPFGFEAVRARIEHGLREHEGRFIVISVPNIAAVLYGRDVGYSVERIELDADIEAISGTAEREKMRA